MYINLQGNERATMECSHILFHSPYLCPAMPCYAPLIFVLCLLCVQVAHAQEHYKRTFVALHDEVLAAFRTLSEDK